MGQATLKTPGNLEDHYLGSLNALVTMVEYGDFECPHCAAAEPILERLIRDFEENICFIYRHFPLVSLHPNAGIAAVASEAAALQGKFWEMHHALFANQYDLSSENVLAIARDIGIDLRKFLNDWEEESLLDRVHRDIDSGNKNGINGTPTIFINGILFEGVPSYDELREEVELILRDDQVYL